jgi:hypothetical protein
VRGESVEELARGARRRGRHCGSSASVVGRKWEAEEEWPLRWWAWRRPVRGGSFADETLYLTCFANRGVLDTDKCCLCRSFL